MTARFTLEMPEELLARVNEARGLVARNAWIRQAIERALNGPSGEPYRQHVPGPNVENVRSSSQAKRDVKPIPKKEKR